MQQRQALSAAALQSAAFVETSMAAFPTDAACSFDL
jgi:hypothetical protein